MHFAAVHIERTPTVTCQLLQSLSGTCCVQTADISLDLSMQEETDDIISRDINRTFPEHPQFGFEQGQQALFRVLKAYSLHDLEVCPMANICLNGTNCTQPGVCCWMPAMLHRRESVAPLAMSLSASCR